jgi:ABC-type Fe3+/spermidine/putrescine transport system ATPase subunit
MAITSTSTVSVATNSADTAPLLSVREIAKRFGNTDVLHRVSLDVAAGEFLTILGESGSGKTTLLRLIAGFEQPTAGEIWMGGERLDTLPPYRRKVNTVFQNYALFPHLSVFENVAYGMRVRKTDAKEVIARVDQALAMVKMSAWAKASPGNISGGQQQRVALARALVNRPQVMLLDEPLSALDANLRREVQIELKSLQREVGITFIFVTHDQEEAMVMSDRIALLRAGELEQVATPREIYERPATAYTAQFIGRTNLLHGFVDHGIARCGSLSWPCELAEGPVIFSLRPECIRLCDRAPGPNAVYFRAHVTNEAFQGATELLVLETGDDLSLSVRVPARGDLSGELQFEFSPDDCLVVKDKGASNVKDSSAAQEAA